jgi:Mrp family chromosome partitioning ATPase
MARIRDLLRQGDVLRLRVVGQGVVRPDAPHVFRPAEDNSVPAAEEEIPFIEVGGPNKAMEASPSVLAAARPANENNVSTSAPDKAADPEPDAPPAAHSASSEICIRYRPVPPSAPPLAPPERRFSPELLALYQPDHAVSEQYRVMLSAMEAQVPGLQPHVVLFTAATDRAETTTVLLNLAITRARQARGKLVVVDANLRDPAAAKGLGLPDVPGLAEVLAGSVSLRKVVQETGLSNLYLLPAGQASEGGSLLVAAEAMRAVLRHLRQQFTWVFINAPCWDGRPDVVALGSACDAVYLVVPQSLEQSVAVNRLQDLILLQGSRLRGCVVVPG